MALGMGVGGDGWVEFRVDYRLVTGVEKSTVGAAE